MVTIFSNSKNSASKIILISETRQATNKRTEPIKKKKRRTEWEKKQLGVLSKRITMHNLAINHFIYTYNRPASFSSQHTVRLALFLSFFALFRDLTRSLARERESFFWHVTFYLCSTESNMTNKCVCVQQHGFVMMTMATASMTQQYNVKREKRRGKKNEISIKWMVHRHY